ncbi:hypothetical protein F900_01400 [Acinetobacter modestus]|uniref:Uncharacterized protein n=1 Tax=Acinetobacter modestus TaxID=1776740 RepID=N9N9K0_9GAMM|nr:hypothetical protein [Acinetobacter modestus]ENX02336.1 hypothetical protein F900_01400 [Acinetobacter modestus]
MPKFIALQSVGALLPGEEIKGLNDDRIQALLASGAIEEYKPPEQTPSNDSEDELEKLKGEVEDLKASNKQLETEKTTALSEVEDLKAKVLKLEADLATATAKPAKEKPTADKGAPETK